jgi:hypothetical protein
MPLVSQAEKGRRDGNWWTTQTAVTKLDYMIGFFDGIELGHEFSEWGLLKDSAQTPCISSVTSSYGEHIDKYLAHVTNDQLVDGLDVFYKDYRNRRIRIRYAVWLVVNGIAGKPQAEIDRMTENFRESASQ